MVWVKGMDTRKRKLRTNGFAGVAAWSFVQVWTQRFGINSGHRAAVADGVSRPRRRAIFRALLHRVDVFFEHLGTLCVVLPGFEPRD